MIVGLTGGIGSGKSTVARYFSEYGATVVDADEISRSLTRPGQPALESLAQQFGPDILGPDGVLDRALLATRAFAHTENTLKLNNIMHPLISAQAKERISAAAGDTPIVYDMPLLVETGGQAFCDVVVVVDLEPEIQVERLVTFRGLSEADARARMKAQATRDERLAIADFVINNDGIESELERQSREVWNRITERQ